MKTTTVLETQRLQLRYLEINDIHTLMHLFQDPVAMKYFPSVKTINQTTEWVEKNLLHYEKYGFGLYACIKKQDSHFIGYCGFIPQKDVNGKDEIEIGYGLIRSYWHNGYASEAATGCKNHGFTELKCTRLISLIRPENIPSINVAKNIGMEWEADIIRCNMLHGVYSIEKVS